MAIPTESVVEDEEDTEIVRTTFRIIIQRGVLLGLFMSTLHCTMFLLHGDPSWQISVGTGLALVPLYQVVSTRRSYPVFLIGLGLMVVLLVGAVSVLAMRYGRHAGFHLMLVAVIPTLMVSGRIGMRSKWILVALIGTLLLWLESSSTLSTPGRSDVSVAFLEQLRISNIAALLITLGALMQHYFLVIVRTQRRLMEYASIDPLTGLYNRRHLMNAAAQEVAKTERYGGTLCLALADLDHFKKINDSLGHDVGDAVLRHTSQVIRSVARHADCVCRWGGEEFLVLLPETDLEGALHIAERICARVADAQLDLAEKTLRVTLTLGVAMLKPGEAFEGAVRRADEALYAGKAAGRNRAVIASST